MCSPRPRAVCSVVKSSQLPAKITTHLVSIGWLHCLAFLYEWRFLNKISQDWPLALTTQLSTSKLSDNPAVYSCFGAEAFWKALSYSAYSLLSAKNILEKVSMLIFTQKSAHFCGWFHIKVLHTYNGCNSPILAPVKISSWMHMLQ